MQHLLKTDEWRKDLEKFLKVDTYMDSRGTRKYLDQQYSEIEGILTDIGLAKAGN